jgi:hypothetical protein
MDSAKLDLIGKLAAARLPRLIAEAETELQEAIARVTEESQHHGTEKLTFKITHSIELDLGKNTQRDTISFGVRVKHGVAGTLPDPESPELDLGFGDDLGEEDEDEDGPAKWRRRGRRESAE